MSTAILDRPGTASEKTQTMKAWRVNDVGSIDA